MRLRSRTLLFITLLFSWGSIIAQDDEVWPKEITGKEGTIIIYQPQIESFDGNQVEARAAIALKLSSEPDTPLFGAVWMSARVDTNRDTRMYSIRELKISDVRFADAKKGDKQKLSKFLQDRLTESDFTLSLDQLLTGLDVDTEVDKNKLSETGLKHKPPKIILSTEPAVLIPFDGKPIIQDIKDSKLQQVVNTPFLVVKSGKYFYLSGGGDLWYRSKSALGPWQISKDIPKAVTSLEQNKDAKKTRQSDDQVPPKVIVATEPSELIVSDGKPVWAAVEGMGLLYMNNTDSDVFLELSTQDYYTLLSGRWYRTTALGEQWDHVPNDELPKAFADIDPDSPNGHVLSQVSGTQQAQEAILDNTIPQTSAIRRDDSSVSVLYDGEPKFVDIEKIRVQYAVNTESAVFKVNNRYYLAAQGVWYESSSAQGPWIVATSIPKAIYSIPPSNPHYNVVFVRIYDVMPDVVYVGYTPGYLHSYYYHGTVVYGTGWYYKPWHHRVYYPRPWTWGFRVAYSPWIGWSFGLGWTSGPFSFYFDPWPYPHFHHHYAWYGPGGYYPHYRPYVKKGYRKHKSHPHKHRYKRNKVVLRPNIYHYPKNAKRNIERRHKRSKTQARVAKDWKNNVFTDKQGNIYRRDKNGQWQQRHKGKWKRAENLDNPRTPKRVNTAAQPKKYPVKSKDRRKTKNQYKQPRSTQPKQQRATQPKQQQPRATRPQLERDHSKRQRGTQRSNQYQKQWKDQSQPRRSNQRQQQGGGNRSHSPRSRNRH